MPITIRAPPTASSDAKPGCPPMAIRNRAARDRTRVGRVLGKSVEDTATRESLDHRHRQGLPWSTISSPSTSSNRDQAWLVGEAAGVAHLSRTLPAVPVLRTKISMTPRSSPRSRRAGAGARRSSASAPNKQPEDLKRRRARRSMPWPAWALAARQCAEVTNRSRPKPLGSSLPHGAPPKCDALAAADEVGDIDARESAAKSDGPRAETRRARRRDAAACGVTGRGGRNEAG